MFESRQTTIPFPSSLNDYYCEEKKGTYGPQFSEAYSYGASYIDNSIPQKEKDPGSFTLPCYINNVCFDNALANLGASDVKVPLILGRPFLSIAYAKIDVFKRKITLRVGDEKIIFKSVKPASSLIKRVYISLDPLYGDYIELNDLNVPLELKRDQVDDLMPTIRKGLRHDKKIRLIVPTIEFSCMIDFEVLERYGMLIVDEGIWADVIFVANVLREG
ncbi:hypothetical protein Tco_0939490 [Tanacetum coccineum]|uniref:Uncharacterized protein n=1 Tax=Tanacetum coccineum TaxID=301880 RepID=A0ABQ5DKT0_9ASTR